jgi:hypothetical protein
MSTFTPTRYEDGEPLSLISVQTQDFEALIRISREFNFPITALHHASEAYLFAEKIKAEREDSSSPSFNRLTAAIFADHGYYKAEVCYFLFFD